MPACSSPLRREHVERWGARASLASACQRCWSAWPTPRRRGNAFRSAGGTEEASACSRSSQARRSGIIRASTSRSAMSWCAMSPARATTSHPASRPLLVRGRAPRGPPGSCSPRRSRADGGAARAWAVWSAGGPVPAGVRVDGVGSHRFPGDPSRAFALLQDPGRISGPSPKRSHRCCPRAQHDEGFSGHMISRLPQGFGTRCLRFAGGVAVARARLASGWLVGLCRERVELSGSRRKVSERSHVVLLSRAYPVASWVHAERLVHKLDTFTDHQRRAQQHVRSLIWWFYRDLKAYRREPIPRRRSELRARFDRIFRRRTGFVVLDRLLARLHANKAELLRVLDRPEIPLHTNGSENDIRAQVTRRKVSGGTRSDMGRDCRDVFLGLMKTCQKLGVSFWNYLGTRLAVPDQPAIPYLPQLVQSRCRPA